MKPVRTLLFSLATILMSSGGSVAVGATEPDKPKIAWAIWDLPPEFVKDGPWKNKGYADRFLHFFMQNMPEYDHRIDRVNVSRWSQNALEPNRCAAHLWAGFFPGQLVLSKAYTFTPPHVLIFHKRHQKRIGIPGSAVSLNELLVMQPDLKLLIVKLNFNDAVDQGRYPVLQPILAPWIGSQRIVEVTGESNEARLSLLDYGRADYTIGYPSSITTQQRVYGLGDDYVAYAIKEHDLYKKVHVACYNDAFGKEVVAKVNGLLTPDTYREFLSFHEDWNGGDPDFRRTTIDYFIRGKPLPNVID